MRVRESKRERKRQYVFGRCRSGIEHTCVPNGNLKRMSVHARA